MKAKVRVWCKWKMGLWTILAFANSQKVQFGCLFYLCAKDASLKGAFFQGKGFVWVAWLIYPN
jgi:hypothetical protein